MPLTARERREKIINNLFEIFDKKLDQKQAKLLKSFAPLYYSIAPIDDLEVRDHHDLYGALLSHWNLLYQRIPGETKIHIYNPQYEEHGWQSTHTIIEVVHDDMPFLVDSLRMEINRLGYAIHLGIHVGGMQIKRNAQHQVEHIFSHAEGEQKGVTREAPIYFEIDRETDPKALETLKSRLEKILSDVRATVEDWSKMQEKLAETIKILEQTPLKLDPTEIEESINFLRWVLENHFTFLGIRSYDLEKENGDYLLRRVPGTGLGVLRDDGQRSISRTFAKLPPKAREVALSPHLLIISKTNTRASVHHPAYTDYIGIKRYNEQGEIIGELRVIGLYTSTAYHTDPREIPFLSHKVVQVTKQLGYAPNSHSARDLLNILTTLPRDDLFQASVGELAEICDGILQLQERTITRLFVREDPYGRFVSCLVYVPREIFNTQLRLEFEKILMVAFNGQEINFSTYFSESILARVHFVVRIDSHQALKYEVKEIEKQLIAVGIGWQDQLTAHLIEHCGEEEGISRSRRYIHAFPSSYQQDFDPHTAVFDIAHMEDLQSQTDLPIAMSFYRPVGDLSGQVSFKVFCKQEMPLSDVVPMLEHMGLRIIRERPYEIKLDKDTRLWINDFSMCSNHEVTFDVDEVKPIFHEAFAKIWRKEAEDDGFNQMVLGAKLDWRGITVLRAYAKYFRQIGFTFSQQYIEETVATYSSIARSLVDLFNLRFNPEANNRRAQEESELVTKIKNDLEKVSNLDQDRILRRYLEVILATTRTNYYQVDSKGQPKTYLSLKFNPEGISELPLPRPEFEIFVYSPRVEGVHLRKAKVARGGLRWSDRREDFRTEILGLMKAQQVKNAVIVPMGAKGGFVPKLLPLTDDRDVVMAEVKECYKTFIRGLLDLTDNLKNGEVIPPANTIRYEEDDIYLVVAADKGTATFSDLANSVSEEYGFWLGDAFASGGSSGYDHKKMGITARGAWESVKRHFRGLGVNTQTTDFTVAGVGDMSGDVFGNGMLLSEHIRLVAAFDHRHIFLDPDPDSAVSFKERQRLFNLSRSSWEDYDTKLISKGGGVYRRSLKSIQLSPEIKARLQITEDQLTPNQLVSAILKAPVDLLWNGGIGTYVKAKQETHLDVGDRSNDAVRVNGADLRCRVVGEGGNLGFTQLARVEYALKGGRNYTDFIDNSAGVNCSDFEVNIKILLNDIVTNGDMTPKQRDILLAEMTEEVGQLVLKNNYAQTHAISLAMANALENMELYSRYILELERQGKIDRALEFLPTEDAMHERKVAGQGLTQPELAILLSYTKIIIKSELLNSDVPEDPYLRPLLKYAFPETLQEQFAEQMQKHSLRREIIATQISNLIVNEMGITFVHRLMYETGASMPEIVRAYAITRQLYQLPDVFHQIDAIDNKVPTILQHKMIIEIVRLMRRVTRWFLRHHRGNLEITQHIERYSEGVRDLIGRLPNALCGNNLKYVESVIEDYKHQGVPDRLALRIGSIKALYPSLDIVEGALTNDYSVEEFAGTYYALGDRLHLGWLRQQIGDHQVDNHWDAMARSSLRDDIDHLQVGIVLGILKNTSEPIPERIVSWTQKLPGSIARWEAMLTDLRSMPTRNFTMFLVIVRECLDLAKASHRAWWAGMIKK